MGDIFYKCDDYKIKKIGIFRGFLLPGRQEIYPKHRYFNKHKLIISEEWLHWWDHETIYVGNITTFVLVVDCWLNWSCPLDTNFAPNIVLTQDKGIYSES